MNPLVAEIRAQLDAMDGMVDDTITFVLRAAAERIRRAPHDGTGDTWGWWDAAEIPGHCADLIDPDKQEQQ